MTARRRMRTFGILLATAAAAAPVAVRASKADLFENKIEPVSGQLYQKAKRFEITLPSANLSLNDAFFHKYFVGAKLGYHFSEMFSASGSFATGINAKTGSTSLCTVDTGCGPASAAQLYQVPGYIRMMAGAEVAFSPVYGKLNVLAENAVHLDLSVMAGADWISHREVLSNTDVDTMLAAGQKPGYRSTFGGHLGLGARIFLSNTIALRLELKDYIYSVPIGNYRGSKDANDIQNQLFAEVGLSFFLPFGYKANP
jgi:outer membrane beta-barrel protein